MIQCSNGHVVCNKCHPQLTNCPVCRTNFIPTKTRVLEDILNLIPHCCKHETCEVFVKPGDDHELWCGLLKCGICDWNGCAKDLICHVKQCHEISLISANTNVEFLYFYESCLAFFDQDQFFLGRKT